MESRTKDGWTGGCCNFFDNKIVVGDLDKNCYGFLPSFPSFSFISVRVFKYLYVLYA